MQQQAVTKGPVVFESSDSPRTATITPSIRPKPKSLQLRPSQSNFRCHNITEKSEYDIKNPTTAPAEDRRNGRLYHHKQVIRKNSHYNLRLCIVQSWIT